MSDIVDSLLSPRIRVGELARLCGRLSTSLAAGLDMRTIWDRESSANWRSVVQRRCSVIRDAVAAGEEMADALDQCGDFFPELFRQLVRVGEESGKGPEVLAQLGEHYQSQLKRRRIFLAAITWPVIELVIALAVVGLVILISGLIGDGKTDILGFGLTGTDGLALYVAILSGMGMVLLVLGRAFQRGVFWIRPVQRAVLRVPAIGPMLELLALSRIAWVLHLTMNTGMDVRRALRLSLASTDQSPYLDHIPIVDDWIAQGGSIHEAFVQAGGYPPEFLDALDVAEQSGRMVESMGKLSEQYQGQARFRLAAVMTLAGFLVWGLVALLIIFFIFQIFASYYGALSGLTGP